jgi:hypothetical protein
MKRQVDIYIEGTTSGDYLRLDLFGDEKINISSSIQNVQDISKVYTDFSQSFTVPASDNNNKIFEYFYQNDVDNVIDHNLRRNAFIEIGLVPFRSGKIQLEGSSVKNGKVEHYSITFYGDLVSLKDRFGNTKINQLDYSFVSNPYSGAAVKDRVTDTATDYDVRYPLIASEKFWSYGDGTSTDINTSAGRIDWRELFPAIKVSKIFEAIQNKYSLTFQSTFLQTNKFQQLFLWCKNTDNLDNKINGSDLPITSYTNYPNQYGYASDFYNAENNSYYIYTGLGSQQTQTNISVTFGIDNPPIITDPQWIFYIDVFINGVFNSTVIYDTAIGTSLEIYSANGNNLQDILTIKIRSEQNINIKYTVSIERFYDNYTIQGGFFIGQNTTGLNLTNSTNSIFANMPDITVSDFFSGILKEFNLTCYSVGVGTYQIEPLDNWYSKGAIIDVTKYVDTDTISVDRLPLYKNISFNYQKSESFLNRQWGNLTGREWGDISNNYDYDGGEYKIDVPFENLKFQKLTGVDMQVAYCLTTSPDFKPYIPKPILLYLTATAGVAVKFYDGSTESTITSLAVFGQDLYYNNQVYSLNFSSDTSTWTGELVDNSLFAIYYFGYLSNLFNTKNRLTKIKAFFPIGLITSLRLNDRLVIQDKRYIINTINSDITTGEVSLELINDFRPIIKRSNV